MSTLAVNLGGTAEEETVPEGEYTLECTQSISRRTKADDRDMAVLTFVIQDAPDEISFPAAIQDFFVLPNEDDWQEDKEMAHRFIRRLRRALTCLGVPYEEDGFDSDDCVGTTATVGLYIDKNDDTGEDYNRPRWPKYKNE